MTMVTSWKELRFLWRSDLHRYHGKSNIRAFLYSLQDRPGFRYTFLMRLGNYLHGRRTNLFGRIVYRFYYEILRHYQMKFGIIIPPETKIGSGLYIDHFGGIVVNANAVIGKNCNIGQGVTIGQTNRGSRQGCPTIGDNVYIAPGAKIIGKIQIGNNVAIGANAVVTRDVPDDAVAIGNPAEVVSSKGSVGYINRTDYE